MAVVLFAAFGRPSTEHETATPASPPTTPPPSPPTTPSADRTASYGHNFDGARTWPQSNDALATYAYVDGQYQVAVRARDSDYFARAPSPELWRTVRVEVDATKMSDATAVYGASCRMASGAKPAHYVGVVSSTARGTTSRTARSSLP
ncbi:MAG: hypothetical protein ACRD12_01120 [Acidimicrobiales bacterium]